MTKRRRNTPDSGRIQSDDQESSRLQPNRGCRKPLDVPFRAPQGSNGLTDELTGGRLLMAEYVAELRRSSDLPRRCFPHGRQKFNNSPVSPGSSGVFPVTANQTLMPLNPEIPTGPRG